MGVDSGGVPGTFPTMPAGTAAIHTRPNGTGGRSEQTDREVERRPEWRALRVPSPMIPPLEDRRRVSAWSEPRAQAPMNLRQMFTTLRKAPLKLIGAWRATRSDLSWLMSTLPCCVACSI